MRHAPYATVFPIHAGSRRIDTANEPVPELIRKSDAWKLYDDCQRRENATRKFNRQDGDITRNGLAVLRTLIRHFWNWNSGQCDPSYETIAQAAGMSARSVYSGLVALKNAKVLNWWLRCKAVASPVGGFILEQVSNLYRLNFSPPWRRERKPPPIPTPDTIGTPESVPDDPVYDHDQDRQRMLQWEADQRARDPRYQEFLQRRKRGAV